MFKYKLILQYLTTVESEEDIKIGDHISYMGRTYAVTGYSYRRDGFQYLYVEPVAEQKVVTVSPLHEPVTF